VSANATPQLRGLRDAGARCLLALYKRVVSPVMHALAGSSGACRFQPTCSEYAAIAIAEYGLLKGTAMALGRVVRCHPLHGGGFDPVPAKHSAGALSVRAGQIH
jgi:uncharacterized protein